MSDYQVMLPLQQQHAMYRMHPLRAITPNCYEWPVPRWPLGTPPLPEPPACAFLCPPGQEHSDPKDMCSPCASGTSAGALWDQFDAAVGGFGMVIVTGAVAAGLAAAIWKLSQ